MSYFQRPDAGLEQSDALAESPRSPFEGFTSRIARWFVGVDRADTEIDPEPETSIDTELHDRAQLFASETDDVAPAFPLAPFGYNRAAVDGRLAELELELADLRSQQRAAPVSITEEIERIGEQTASILVVAHDQAHETTRRAQEQADRCIADAASSAASMTEEAKQRLNQLDSETDLVWRERERLLEDVRVVSGGLATLADEASARFPAESRPPDSQATLS